MAEPTDSAGTGRGLSRRRALGLAGAGAGAVAIGGAGSFGGGQAVAASAHSVVGSAQREAVVAFRGAHQAGIATAVQERLQFASFDVAIQDRAGLVEMLRAWTAAAERMCAGREAQEPGAFPSAANAAPGDSGETVGLAPARLTLTIGFGPSLFQRDGQARFGLQGAVPGALRDLPAFSGDALDARQSGGDLAVQACSDDPQVAAHAIRNLARIAGDRVSLRWTQLGFGKSSSTTPQEQTPRNAFGFKHGTNNIAASDATGLDRHVWVAGSDQEWLRGGTYLVTRRIRMVVEDWDRVSLSQQEKIIGRDKREGAPTGGRDERDPVVMASQPGGSHVALSAPQTNDGATLLRRSYSFMDGSDDAGRLDTGLFFISFQNDPAAYVKVQQRLAESDGLNRYIRHTGSGVWAVPPGLSGDGRFWGDS
ncbi:MAG: iron uptake transporter deferrochelatase/peroxidase subunit, partial [Sporichthyaceae bacterium]